MLKTAAVRDCLASAGARVERPASLAKRPGMKTSSVRKN
jgi:hypothetical protein